VAQGEVAVTAANSVLPCIANPFTPWGNPNVGLESTACLSATKFGNQGFQYLFFKIKLRNLNMAIERTLSIIKPDAVAKNVIGQIYARFEAAGLKVVAARMAHLSRGEAEAFYAVHKERPFFKDLVGFMISGPVMIQALEGEGAILKNRDLMGATDPKKAAPGTIRADFADSIDANAVHGSDAPETAAVEVGFFFPGMNVYSR
jgi:nucleoside-diphosphate kinase